MHHYSRDVTMNIFFYYTNTVKEVVSAKIRPDLNYKTPKTAGVHVPTVPMAPTINFVT